MKTTVKTLILLFFLFLGIGNISSNPFSVIHATAATTFKETTFQTTANVNLRAGAGTNYKVIMTIPKGKAILSKEKNGRWYKVSYTFISKNKKVTKKGWIAEDYVIKTKKLPEKPKISNLITFQTTSNLNMRSGPGTKYKIVTTLPKDSILTSQMKKGDWYKVSYTYSKKGKKTVITGWTLRTYLKEYYNHQKIINTYVFTVKSTRIYPTPDKRKKSIKTIGSNNGFLSTEKVKNSIGETWYRVSIHGKKGFINADQISKASSSSFAKKKVKTTKDSSLHSTFGTSFKILTKVPKNIELATSLKIGNWYKVSYKGKSGYIYSNNLKEGSIVSQPKKEVTSNQSVILNKINNKTFITTSKLNLRKTPSVNSTILGTIPEEFFIFPTHRTDNGEWYKTVYKGETGYISARFITEVITGNPYTRSSYQYIDLRKPSKVTAAQINKYIEQYLGNGKVSILTGKGQAFIDAGNKHGVNALYLAAHAIHESGYGTSNISLGKYNLFGFGAFDAAPYIGALRFSSVEQNIEYIAQEMKATYLNPLNWKFKGAYLGFSTKTIKGNSRIDSLSEGMNFYYASDVTWGKSIASHMQKILPYNRKDYDNAKPNIKETSYPARPEGKDVFPSGIQGKAKKNIPLYSKKGNSKVAATLKSGDTFYVREKHNDFWIKINYQKKDYWTNYIKLDKYKEVVVVKNLGRVTVDSLNVRPTPSTNQKPIDVVKLNQYIQLNLDKKGNVIMDTSKTWYNIRLSSGKNGWVSAKYVIMELK